MKARWQQLQARFSAAAPREKAMVALAALALTAFVIDALWLSPALASRQAVARELAQKRNELQTATAQLAALRQQAELERVQGEATLRRLADEYRSVSGELGELARKLIAAREMPAFLRNVLPAHGRLEVVGLRTLAVAPLLPPKTAAGADPVAGAAAAAGAVPVAAATAGAGGGAENLYRHSVEIRLAGSYADLFAYLQALEAAPKQVLWGSLQLEVQKHPVSVLTLTVHTLSLDRSWLAL